jgi:hypothetical protein
LALNSYSFLDIQARRLKEQRSIIGLTPEGKRAQVDFEFFRQYVCNHESPGHHKRWINVLNSGEDSKCLRGVGGDHTLILAPRGSAKSTLQLEWVAWIIGVHTSPFHKIPLKVLYISYSIEVAMLKSEQIQEILLSQKYQEVFPHIRPGRKWGQKVWDIDKSHAGLSRIGEPYTLSCAGMKGAVASKRAHLCVFDDIIKSPEQIENPVIRERMENNWANVIRPVMYEGGRAVCLGTRMTGFDIYQTTFTKERGWKVIEESAILEDDSGEEKSYWEEQFSLKYFQQLREDEPISFSFQYMNKIPAEGQGVVHLDWIQDGTPPPIEEFDSIALSSDFSSSLKEKADYTVFLLLGKRGDQFWILDMRRGRWNGNIDKCDVALALLVDWGILELHPDEGYSVEPRTGKITWTVEKPRFYSTGYYVNLFAEGQSYQLSFRGDWVSYVQGTLNVSCITCIPIMHRGDKLQRLRGVSGVMQKKRVFFNKYRKLKKIKQELLSFGSWAKDDCVDAFVLGLSGLGARPNLDTA